MINIIHKIRPHGGTMTEVYGMEGKDFYHQVIYAIGKVKPNYPVPAIPVVVDFFPNRVVIWNLSKANEEGFERFYCSY